jgi:serine protease inhibitor
MGNIKKILRKNMNEKKEDVLENEVYFIGEWEKKLRKE